MAGRLYGRLPWIIYPHTRLARVHMYRGLVDQRLSIYVTENVLSPNTLHHECPFA